MQNGQVSLERDAAGGAGGLGGRGTGSTHGFLYHPGCWEFWPQAGWPRATETPPKPTRLAVQRRPTAAPLLPGPPTLRLPCCRAHLHGPDPAVFPTLT